jgi:hypothetical protein
MTITQLAAAIMNDNLSREDLRDFAAGIDADTAAAGLAAALAAMDELLTQTVDADLAYGIGLTEGECDARAACLAVFEKYGPAYGGDRTVEGMPT